MDKGSVRVLHVSPAWFGPEGCVGGGERYSLELARAMADRVPTTLVSFCQEPRRFVVGNLTVVLRRPLVNLSGQPANPLSIGLLRELSQATVIHCHQRRYAIADESLILGRLLGKNVFVSDLGGGAPHLRGHLSLERGYDGHLHLSQFALQLLGQKDNSFHHVIYGGVDTEKFCADSRLSKDGSVVYVGRLLPHKGVNYLVEAVDPGTPLKLIGEPYDPRFLADLKILAEGKNVSFCHHKPDEFVIDAYRAATVVVLPSVYQDVYGGRHPYPELLGQTLIEAMATGTPVIASNVASLPEVVTDGVTGFVVQPNDPKALREKIDWLLAHPEKAKEMGQAARQRVLKHFTWKQVVDKCLKIYSGETVSTAGAWPPL